MLQKIKFTNNFILIFFVFCSCRDSNQKKLFDLFSPNKKIKFQLYSENGKHQLSYSLSWNDTSIINTSSIGIDIQGKEFEELTIAKIQYFNKDTLVSPIIATKRKVFRDHYNAILINFIQPLALEIRMYDEGMAFRWIGKAKHPVKVINETFEVTPIEDAKLFCAPYEKKEELKQGFINFIKRHSCILCKT
jgi:alpha-glucosidase